MRYTIWEKDDFFLVGAHRWDMDPTVVSFADEPLPLVWSFNWTMQPLGKVTDLRCEDGEITGEVTFFESVMTEETMNDLGIRLAGYYTEVDKSDGVVHKTMLKAVSVTPPSPGFPNTPKG